MNRKLNILLLTSMPPDRSANLGLDMAKSLEAAGHRVMILTKYKSGNEFLNTGSVYDEYEPLPDNSFRSRLKKKFPFLRYLNFRQYFRKSNNYEIVNRIEDEPPVKVARILEGIKAEYDLVITLFWQSMITALTLKAVYDKLKCPIFIQAVDMFPITGGCFYFWECRRFLDSCGMCPGLNSRNENDETHRNFLLKKGIYSSIEYVFLGNTWMCDWAKKSPLFNPSFVKRCGLVINQDVFFNADKEKARAHFGIPLQKEFVIFAGVANFGNRRKGVQVLVESINAFSARLSFKERQRILLVLAGKDQESIQKYFQIDILNVGFMDIPTLALAYAASDVYLSTTIQDAGPSMVNQALMCGTPVVAFEIGVALDVVETGKTGYRARYKDIHDFSLGISYFYKMDVVERRMVSESCREVALRESSYSFFAARVEQLYEEYVSKKI